jgi:hypothetical protein
VADAPYQLDHRLDISGIDARHDGRVAAAQEAAGAADLGGVVALAHQLADEPLGVVIGDDHDDQLLAAARSFFVRGAFAREARVPQDRVVISRHEIVSFASKAQ